MEDFIVEKIGRDDKETRNFLKRFFDMNKQLKEPWEMIFWTLSLDPRYEGSADLHQSQKDFLSGWRAAEEFYEKLKGEK